MVIPNRHIFARGQRQLEFLISADYVKGVCVSVIIRILDERVPLYGLHVALCLEQNELKVSLETLYR